MNGIILRVQNCSNLYAISEADFVSRYFNT